jgi:hypothetical protein
MYEREEHSTTMSSATKGPLQLGARRATTAFEWLHERLANEPSGGALDGTDPEPDRFS